MLRLISKITIEQVTTTPEFPVRDKTFVFKFVNRVEIESSWQNLTDTCRIVLPKKVIVQDFDGNDVDMVGQSIIGSNATVPLMLRGDKIRVELGYMYPTPTNPEVTEMNIYFDGYISRINPRIPIELECEDRMYQLKQIRVPDKAFPASFYNVQDMVQEMLLLQPETRDIELITGSLVGQKIETNLNDEFITCDDTIASVLDRLRKEAHIYSYFRNVAQPDGTYKSELRCSGIVYYPSDREKRTFVFQKNIIDDSLEYRRQEDIKLGAKCYSLNSIEITTGTNKDGSPKKKQKRLETFIGDKEGELRTLYFWDVKNEAELKELGKRELRKYYYTGYFGKFLTFGIPKVKHGDEVEIKDYILHERDGGYMVKGVRTSFGEDGFRQEIEPHFKLSVFNQSEVEAGL